MKNISKIIICLFLFTLSSCLDSNEELDQLLVNQVKRNVLKFEYQGHSYIQFGQGNMTWGVHNPDCSCLKIK